MKKFVLAPDSFKGTVRSIDVCRLMEERVRAHFPDAEVVSVPVADGGEGTVECFLYALGGERIELRVSSPLGVPVDSFYGILPDGTAVIEMAAAAGLPLAEGAQRPDTATTYGVGELIRDAVLRGCRRLIVGLGGSATNDAGCGAAAALGVKFLNDGGKTFIPTGGTLGQICKIDLSGRLGGLSECKITAVCDIDSPLYGETGAACVFAPQKGADAEMARFLDGQLRAFSGRVADDLGLDVSKVPGAGAAGGMGAGMLAFFNAKLSPGIGTILSVMNFDAVLKDADLVITGEGRLDTQSLRGKAVSGVARAAKAKGVPVVAVVGDVGDGIEPIYECGVAAVLSTNWRAVPFEKAKETSRGDLTLTMDTLMRLLKLRI